MSQSYAIDAHMVGERETGNETYTLNLLHSLLEIDPENEYQVLATNPERLSSLLPASKNLHILRVRPAIDFLRIPLALPMLLRGAKSSLLHVNYIAPPWSPCPTVVTVHDLSFEFFPDFFSARDRILLSTLVPFSLRRAAKVIAVSEWTKKDLVQRYRLPADKIVVTYEAAAPGFRPIDDHRAIARARSKYGLAESFVLTLGNLQPRKNLVPLVRAFNRLRKESRIDIQMVIAGQAGFRASPVFQAARDLGLEREVVFPGYVPQEDLPLLINSCLLFVFPSLYEGFGLPPLEAMACGAAVISSRAASLPEVLGDAALYFDPSSEDELAQAMLSLLTQPDLAAELKAKGLRRAQGFSWRKTAEQTLAIYRQVAGN